MNGSMPDLLKQQIDDLQQRQKKLHHQIQTFAALQQEIVLLKQQAEQNIAARERLQQIAGIMKEQITPINNKMVECIQQLQNHMQGLNSTLRPEKTGNPLIPPQKKPLLGRNFI